jgi:CSLREA domain-containing protein
MTTTFNFAINVSLILLLTATINAATFTVTKTADTNDFVCDADCSLREAVDAANNDGAPSTILFDSSLSFQTVLVTGGELVTRFEPLTINGLGAHKLTISGGGVNRIFAIVDNPAFTLTAVRITGGNGNGGGGGIGGALASFGTANITFDRVHFVGNGASTQAGAVYMNSGTNTISNSTFSGNNTPQCGALSLVGVGNTTITNSTFSGNTTSNLAGAICIASGANVTMTNDTLTANTSSFGGGIWINNSNLHLGNTVLAGNSATGDFQEIWVASGVVTSDGNNHIGNSAGDSTNTSVAITWLGSDTVNISPMLAALTANGGTMPTHLPIVGSPLINTGSNALATAAGLTTDQRGALRVVGGTVDKGAVEFGAIPSAANVSIAGRVLDPRGRGVSGAYLTMSDQTGRERIALTNPFGYYRFDDVAAGVTYIIGVSSKTHQFTPRIVMVTNELTDVDFTPEASK